MTFILLFFALAFGFFLFLYSEFLRLHDKVKTERIIIRILGIALILFFLFQGDFIHKVKEDFFKMAMPINKFAHWTFSEKFLFWKEHVMDESYFFIIFYGSSMFLISAIPLLYIIYTLNYWRKEELKKVDVFKFSKLFFKGFGTAIAFVSFITFFSQVVFSIISIGYKLFY